MAFRFSPRIHSCSRQQRQWYEFSQFEGIPSCFSGKPLPDITWSPEKLPPTRVRKILFYELRPPFITFGNGPIYGEWTVINQPKIPQRLQFNCFHGNFINLMNFWGKNLAIVMFFQAWEIPMCSTNKKILKFIRKPILLSNLWNILWIDSETSEPHSENRLGFLFFSTMFSNYDLRFRHWASLLNSTD